MRWAGAAAGLCSRGQGCVVGSGSAGRLQTRFLKGRARLVLGAGRAEGPMAVQGAVAACLPWRGRAPMAFAGAERAWQAS